jgi:hypothetical protein
VLSLANSETKVQLVLRNPLDVGEKPTRGTSLRDLLVPTALNTAPPRSSHVQLAASDVPRHVASVIVVEVYQGAKKTQESFPLRQEAKR